MTKYTRRKFFKSIIPVSVGIVSFLGGIKFNMGYTKKRKWILSSNDNCPTCPKIQHGGYVEVPGLDGIINTGKSKINETIHPG